MAHDVPNGQSPNLKDNGFEHVSVPHANIITPAEAFDPDVFRFISWYRKHFRPQDSWKDKRVSLTFQGVMTVADICLNGKHLATHEGGYTSFEVDLTPALQFGEDNMLAVPVDSRIQPHIPPEGAPKISPLGLYCFGSQGHLPRTTPKLYGYYLFGGIQRDVELRVTDKLHIERVYYVTQRIQPDAAVGATISVRNDRSVAVETSFMFLCEMLKGTKPEKLSPTQSWTLGKFAIFTWRLIQFAIPASGTPIIQSLHR